MSTDENYQLSVNIWIEGQKKQIQILERNAIYLDEEINLKRELLDNTLKALEHEKRFLVEYLKEQMI